VSEFGKLLEWNTLFPVALAHSVVYNCNEIANIIGRHHMKKIGIFLAEGFEEIEGLTVVDVLRRAGVEVTTMGISGKRQIAGSHGIHLVADAVYEDIAFEELDGIVLPGGMPGTNHLKEHEGVVEQVKKFAAEGKLVAAICAAPSVLGYAGVLQGKQATCYPGFEGQLTGATPKADPVVCDGNVITGRGMGAAIPFALALTEYLLGQEKAKEIAESIQYNPQ
jgi:4-methyl-5(b-hydroxyethyl)-thiazole monophosphate biosynthesis